VRQNKEELAQKAWRLLMRVGERHMQEAGARLTEMGLSPVQGHFLDELARMPAGPMLSLIHISEPTRLGMISYAVF